MSNSIDAYGNPIHPYQAGQVLLGKYRIDRVLGQGGMGIVLGATHVELDHRVAIKLLLPNLPGSEQVEARFLREAQAAASLRSEHVVRVFDVGRLDDGCPYMVMEWLEGRDLASGPLGASLPLDEAVDYVVQACDAMIAAHHRNLVHRDLKPANLFLAHDEHGDPKIKVLDFGISKLNHPGERSLALTDAGGVMGSPLYMSPEQVRSARDVDSRADIWSLGTILYELISGETPFTGETLGAVFVAVASTAPTPLHLKRADIPIGLEAVVMRCLEKEPQLRYQTALELQRALLPYASVRSQAKIAMRSSSAPPGHLPMPPLAPATTARTTGGWTDLKNAEAAKRKPRSKLAWYGVVAVLLTGGIIGSYVVRSAKLNWDGTAKGSLAVEKPPALPIPLAVAPPTESSIATTARSELTAPSVIPTVLPSPPPGGATLPPRPPLAPSKRNLASRPNTNATPPASAVSPSTRAPTEPSRTVPRNPLDIQFK